MKPDAFQPVTARRIRLVGLDVDGVLTDNAVYVGMVDTRPVEFKRFDIADGIGVKLLQAAGLEVAIVSGRMSEATRIRAEELGIGEVVQDDQARKLAALEELLARRGVRIEDTAFMGDDIPDLPVMQRVGLAVTVPHAAAEVRDAAGYVTDAPGGHGAVREFAEALLRARGQWDDVIEDYLATRGDRAPRRSSVHRAL